MKAVKLKPFKKMHAVGYAVQVNVDDLCIDIDDATPVQVFLGRQLTVNGPMIPSPDLPGPSNVISGPWIDVRDQIRQFTPTQVGYFTVVVRAFVNIAAPYPVPPRYEPVVYHGVTVHVIP